TRLFLERRNAALEKLEVIAQILHHVCHAEQRCAVQTQTRVARQQHTSMVRLELLRLIRKVVLDAGTRRVPRDLILLPDLVAHAGNETSAYANQVQRTEDKISVSSAQCFKMTWRSLAQERASFANVSSSCWRSCTHSADSFSYAARMAAFSFA